MKLKIQSITEDKKSISGNTKFIKKNIIPMLKSVGVTSTRVRRFGDQIEVEFDADNNQFNSFQKILKKRVGKEGSKARENFNIQVFENLIKDMVREETINEGAAMRYRLMDKLVKTMGNHKKALEEIFMAMSDKEAKDNVEHILRMWK